MKNTTSSEKKYKKPLPETFKLSKTATLELIEILKKDIGEEALDELSPEEINHFGVLMLTLTAAQLKIKIREIQKDL